MGVLSFHQNIVCNKDWYLHMPVRHMNYYEATASFKFHVLTFIICSSFVASEKFTSTMWLKWFNPHQQGREQALWDLSTCLNIYNLKEPTANLWCEDLCDPCPPDSSWVYPIGVFHQDCLSKHAFSPKTVPWIGQRTPQTRMYSKDKCVKKNV